MFRLLRLLLQPLPRIATALESLARLYKLDLESRGIVEAKPGLRDEVELTYQHRELAQDELED